MSDKKGTRLVREGRICPFSSQREQYDKCSRPENCTHVQQCSAMFFLFTICNILTQCSVSIPGMIPNRFPRDESSTRIVVGVGILWAQSNAMQNATCHCQQGNPRFFISSAASQSLQKISGNCHNMAWRCAGQVRLNHGQQSVCSWLVILSWWNKNLMVKASSLSFSKESHAR